MYCRKCGKEIANNQEFCQDCRQTMEEKNKNDDNIVVLTESGVNTSHVKRRKKCCPKCKSRNLQMVTNTEYHSQTSGGGYSAGKGCCGYMALGPLGFLCGACGSKSKTTVKSTSSDVWVCHDCGNKFRDADEIDKDIQNQMKERKITPLMCYVFGGVFLVTGLPLIFSRLDYFGSLALLSAPITFIVCGIGITKRIDNTIIALKEEKKNIEENGYIYE